MGVIYTCPQKNQTAIVEVSKSPSELDSFNLLQAAITSERSLFHHNPQRRTYVKVDASGKGFGAVIFHIADKCRRRYSYVSRARPELLSVPANKRFSGGPGKPTETLRAGSFINILAVRRGPVAFHSAI